MPMLIDANTVCRANPATTSPTSSGTTPASASPADHTSLPQLAYNPAVMGLTPREVDFDAQMRGKNPHAMDMDMARLAQDVYETGSSKVGNWTRLDADQLRAAGIDPDMLEDPATGFRAAVYQDADGHHVLAFAGTDPTSGKDWLANGMQGVGLPATQYSQAVTLATRAKAAFGDNLAMTGHSLGGGLASAASVATDTAAVTFNAAGINDATLNRMASGGDIGAMKSAAENGLIRSYAVKGEVLTGEQEHGAARGFAPDALGHRITLDDPYGAGFGHNIPGINLITDTIHGGKLHMMGSVIDAMKADHPWNPDAANAPDFTEQVADATMDVADKAIDGVDSAKNHTKSGINRVADKTGDFLDRHVGGTPGKVLDVVAKGTGKVLSGAVEVGGNLVDGMIGTSAHVLQGAERLVGSTVKGISKAMPWNW